MKKILIICAIALIFVACHSKKEATVISNETDSSRIETLQNGDLIFVGIPMCYSLAPDAVNVPVNDSTCAGDSLNLVHVAIAEVRGDSAWIIDATIRRNVNRYPLDTFLNDFKLADGGMPLLIVKRLVDNSNVEKYIENAKKFIGRKYDVDFSPDNDAQFCSELVSNSYVTSDGKPVFSQYPMNFQKVDGTFPLYWQQLFGFIHSEIPQGRMGTTPAQMAAEKCLKTVPVKLVK